MFDFQFMIPIVLCGSVSMFEFVRNSQLLIPREVLVAREVGTWYIVERISYFSMVSWYEFGFISDARIT